ncbi:MAG: hypothetical protein ACE5K7_04145 [Phycisphaerae bacterium]
MARLLRRSGWLLLGATALLAAGCDSLADDIIETIGLGLSIADIWV